MTTTQTAGQVINLRDQVRRVYGPLAIIAVVVPLLQWHSIVFWQAMTGELSGVAWSIGLEIVNLWLWFRDEPWPKEWKEWWRLLPAVGIRCMAVITTGILLFGPLYNVSAPLFKEAQAASRISESMSDWTSILNAANQQDADKAGSLAIKAVREKDKLRAERDKKDGQNKATTDYQRFIAIGMQFFSLIVLYWAVVLSISALAREPKRIREQAANHKPAANPPAANRPILDQSSDSNSPESAAATAPDNQPTVKTYTGPNAQSPPVNTPEKRAVDAFGIARGFKYQTQVAEAIGEQKSTLSEFIRGNVTPPVHGRIMAKLTGSPQS